MPKSQKQRLLNKLRRDKAKERQVPDEVINRHRRKRGPARSVNKRQARGLPAHDTRLTFWL